MRSGAPLFIAGFCFLGRRAGGAVAILLAAASIGIGLGIAPAAAGEPTLQVSDPAATATTLDIDQLRAMGETRLATSTSWIEGRQDFVGVTGAQLVAALEAKGAKLDAQSVLAIANNDYSIVIPFAVFAQPATVIAYARNGAAMPVCDKGPSRIVFPYDTNGKFLTSSYKAYSIWGLARIAFQSP